MERILKHKKIIIVISIIATLLAACGFIICNLYSQRDWNSSHFNTFYALWDFYLAYLLEAIALFVFVLIFLFLSNSISKLFGKILTWLSVSILCLGTIAVLITIFANSIRIDKVIQDYKLDCQLESEDPKLFQEAVDALILRDSYTTYSSPTNSFIIKAARNGYPKAQNAMGYFYHERAKSALSQAEYKAKYDNDDESSHKYISQSETDFDHAIYWFLKAAQNGNTTAQTNLGRIFMGDLASNRMPNMQLAKSWLLKACNFNDPDAFYYLGKIYSSENLRDAYVYWSKGAELGNEDCIRALETPEFANGIPADRPLVQIEECDSINQY